ncbi:MerR family transcriptional regulator [Pseudobacteroides cellulosolvens]|uniref:Antibiotic resistance transcriptional regulator, MerR family n=1 Tax=Pseudobacteroides cellulosolvens ATCC 35603 = DSM 2933 TaxID=398512 RepID=A0A0L6JQ90_9FIRM|nr:MerR family transcriptional regulator [Pseudobacteroides cellulosolvens]KNY27953.1 antibiotic resistance transcriptional regulator, MerR family [Pseudobacteroides cellulosolvens ATCC 35603 = DSM 2933]
MRTVNEVSKLTGISIRTLHYYDEIGLLKPTTCNESGYRFYDDKALEALQQILFFKEFDMPLKDIKSIMENPNFDKEKTLINQKKILMLKRKRLDNLIRLIDDILKGDNKMSFQEFSKEEIEEMFKYMKDNLNEERLEMMKKENIDMDSLKDNFIAKVYAEEGQETMKNLLKWYGGKEAVIDSMKEAAKNAIPLDIIQSHQKRTDEIFKELCGLRGKDTTTPEIKRLIAEYEFISKQIYRMKDVKVLLLDIAKGFIEDEDLIKAYDGLYGEGSSVFLGKAIMSFFKE